MLEMLTMPMPNVNLSIFNDCLAGLALIGTRTSTHYFIEDFAMFDWQQKETSIYTDKSLETSAQGS